MALYPNQLPDHGYLPNDRELTTETLFNHATDHNRAAEEIVAIVRELGLNPAGDFEDVAERLDAFEVRISDLEGQQGTAYVAKTGDEMSGTLTTPGLILGNANGNQRGLYQNELGYFSPLENFQKDGFKVLNFRLETLFEVPFDGKDLRHKGQRVLTDGNHRHRSDAEQDDRYWQRSDEIGYQISVRGYDEPYQELSVGTEGRVRLELDTREYNHFKIRSNGASVDVELMGIPASSVRRGVTVALQNHATNSVSLRLLNPHLWPELDPPPDTLTQPGRDTEVFCYTVGEGNHWLVHPYYLNELTRPGTASYPALTAHRFRLFGRGTQSLANVEDDLGTGVKLNFWNGSAFTLDGFVSRATGNRYGVSDLLPDLNLSSSLSFAVLVKGAAAAEQYTAFGALASPNSDANYLRVDRESDALLRARLVNQSGSYDNQTLESPALSLRTGNEEWTLLMGVKTDTGYGVRNVNRFAAGLTDYEAFREYPVSGDPPAYQVPIFDASPNSLRVGVGVVPRQSYPSSPVGLGSFTCGMLLVFYSPLEGSDMLQLYKAIRQDMTAVGLGTLPAPVV